MLRNSKLFFTLLMRKYREHPETLTLRIPFIPPNYRNLIEKAFSQRTGRQITSWGELINNNGPEQIILISPQRTFWDKIKEKHETSRLGQYWARITDLL